MENSRLLYDLGRLTYEIAFEKGYLATPEKMLDVEWIKWKIQFDMDSMRFEVGSNYAYNTTNFIDTQEHAKEIAKMLNEDEGVKEELERLRKNYCNKK